MNITPIIFSTGTEKIWENVQKIDTNWACFLKLYLYFAWMNELNRQNWPKCEKRKKTIEKVSIDVAVKINVIIGCPQ